MRKYNKLILSVGNKLPLISLLSAHLIFLHQSSLLAKTNSATGIFSPHPINIGSQCERLLEKRETTMALKHKALSMIKRVENMEKNIPKRKLSILKRLTYVKTQTNQHLKLFVYQINALEEQIVRSGCPGIKL